MNKRNPQIPSNEPTTGSHLHINFHISMAQSVPYTWPTSHSGLNPGHSGPARLLEQAACR